MLGLFEKNQNEVTGYQMIKFYFKITKQCPNIIYMKIAGQNLTYNFFKKKFFFFKKSYFFKKSLFSDFKKFLFFLLML